jgi:hypothetical protein
MFEDEPTNIPKRSKFDGTLSKAGTSIDDAIQMLARAGYVVQKRAGWEGG